MTFLLVSYNQEEFIDDAVSGALSQTYAPLELLLSDDCSTDRTFELLSARVAGYSGPHSLILNRTPANVGLIGHLNAAASLASGELIIVAAGDDVSLPNRVTRLVEQYLASGRKAMSLYSNGQVIGPEGEAERLFYPRPPSSNAHELETSIISGFSVLGAAHAWDARLMDWFGDLPEDVAWEDWAIPFRAGLLGRIEYVDEVLVQYRRHDSNVYLGQDHYLSSRRLWFEHLEKMAAQELKVLGSYRRDILTAGALVSDPGSRLRDLMGLVEIASDRARGRLLLARGASLGMKLRVSWRILRDGVWGRRARLRWVATFFAPRPYLLWLRCSGRVSGRSG